MDGFLQGSDNDEFALGYYAEGDLGFIQDAAKAFTTFDRFHCSLMGSTLPNREYMHAAQSYGLRDNDLPPQTEAHKFGFPGHHDLRRARPARHLATATSTSTCRSSALWGQEGSRSRSARSTSTTRAAATGTLPHVSFVDPFFAGSAGEGPGASGDEHPHGDVRTGQAFMADVVHAFMESPQWKRGALFIVYDEWGGFFDHVAPAARPRRPQQPRHQQGLRADGLPHPRAGGVAVRAARPRRRTRPTASSRS